MLSVARDPLHCLSVSLSLLITFRCRPSAASSLLAFLPTTQYIQYVLHVSGLVLFSDRPTYLRSTYNNQTPLYPIAKATPTTYPYLGTLPGLALPCLGPIKSPSSPNKANRASSPTACARKKQRRKIIQRQHRVVAQRGSHHTGSPTTAQNESPRAHDI